MAMEEWKTEWATARLKKPHQAAICAHRLYQSLKAVMPKVGCMNDDAIAALKLIDEIERGDDDQWD